MPSNKNSEFNNSSADINAGAWEKRSINYGATLRSVLFQGMPERANEHFHLSHLRFIGQCLDDGRTAMSILDAGCGYGRISLPLVQKFPQAQIRGMDISPNYLKFYRQQTGREAFIGTVEQMPPEIGTFDYIIVVTVLMYLSENKLKEAFLNLFAHLNPNGKIILIEPDRSGLLFQTCGGLTKILRQSSAAQTGGRCFSSSEITSAVNCAGGRITREERIPATTFFFGPIYLLTGTLPDKWTRFFFRGLAALDALLRNTRLPTLWSFYLIEKNKAQPDSIARTAAGSRK